MRDVLRLGLTGGIGSGKSTVAGLLARHGAVVIDADAISRQTTARGGAAIGAIRQVFGPELIGPDGALDRGRMRTLAFSDLTARQRLEQIIHPLVGQETQRQAEAAARAGARCIVFDIPLLVESSRWRTQLDQVLVIDCHPETQIARVMQRSQLQRAEIERIMAQQANRLQRLQAADHVICNDGNDLSQLTSLVAGSACLFGL
ncbi:MAG: dephospho-CoA kinase [Hylemonella sp.]|uniref:dephospho-CoA kinase n=1 Tax=Hylemonella sp. TaxID=2066020 RepID=UPI0022C37BBA|nr:dephospho-CoA kinase [Hylemonella sp.]MCZ8253729.1 dephospho-CoA kinase [Hylemonella sp.]